MSWSKTSLVVIQGLPVAGSFLFLTFKVLLAVLPGDHTKRMWIIFHVVVKFPVSSAFSRPSICLFSAAASSTLHESLRLALNFLHLFIDCGDLDTSNSFLASSLSILALNLQSHILIGYPDRIPSLVSHMVLSCQTLFLQLLLLGLKIVLMPFYSLRQYALGCL